MKKRILSVLLSVAMVFTIMPVFAATANAQATDTTAPTISFGELPEPTGENGWYKENVTIPVTYADEEGGSGVAKWEYYAPDVYGVSEWKEGTGNSFVLGHNRVFKDVRVRVTDNAGNTSDEVILPVEVKICRTWPYYLKVTATVGGQTYDGSLTEGPVTFTLSGQSPAAKINKWEYSTDNGSSWASVNGTTYNTHVHSTDTPADGVTYIFRATNEAGWTSVESDYTTPVTVKVKNVVTYDVTFNTNGGSSIAGQTINAGGTATEPAEAPTRDDGMEFAGWYADDKFENEFDFTQPITANTTVHAKWILPQNPDFAQLITYGETSSGTSEEYGYSYTWTADTEQDVYKFSLVLNGVGTSGEDIGNVKLPYADGYYDTVEITITTNSATTIGGLGFDGDYSKLTFNGTGKLNVDADAESGGLSLQGGSNNTVIEISKDAEVIFGKESEDEYSMLMLSVGASGGSGGTINVYGKFTLYGEILTSKVTVGSEGKLTVNRVRITEKFTMEDGGELNANGSGDGYAALAVRVAEETEVTDLTKYIDLPDDYLQNGYHLALVEEKADITGKYITIDDADETGSYMEEDFEFGVLGAATGLSLPMQPVGYTVTVENGSGDGNYDEGDTVTIKADTPAQGKKFTGWTSTDGVTFADAKATETTFTMPKKNVTVTATYADLLPGKVIVDGVDLVNGDEDHKINCGDGTAVYDPNTRTLTLTNAEITKHSGQALSACGIYASDLTGDFTIVLNGKNSITLTDTAYDQSGIWKWGNNKMTIQGSGSLSITLFDDYTPQGVGSNNGDLVIKDVTLTFALADGSELNGYALHSNKSITIDNAKISTLDTRYLQCLVTPGDITIKNGADLNVSAIENAVYADGDITITGSTVTATTTDYAGICCWGTTTITNSTVTAHSDLDSGIYSFGLLTISGGNVKATKSGADALNAFGGITIKDNADVTAEGCGSGVYTNDTLTIESGKLTAEGELWAILARKLSDNAQTSKPASVDAIVLGTNMVELSGATIKTDDWTYTTVWDDSEWDEVDKWMTRSYFVDASGTKLTKATVSTGYVVEYKAGADGTGNDVRAIKLPGESLTLQSAIFTRDNYTHTGWATSDGGQKAYDLGGSYTVDKALTLYPVWTPDEYEITYVTNEGAFTNDTYVKKYTYGVGTTLPENVTRDGYTFAGWYEKSDFSGEKVTKIGTTETGKKTYYAKWLSSDASLTAVSVNGTAGTISGTSVSVVLPYGSTLPTDSTAISVTTATGATASVPETADNGVTWTLKVTAEDGITIRNYTIRVSAESGYTITYDLNNGTGETPEEQTQKVGVAFTAATDDGFSRIGYSFLGWATSDDVVAAEYDGGASVSDITADTTLYAVWKIVSYDISYDLAGGTVDGTNPAEYNVESNDITLINPTREGYTFAGWTGTGLDAAAKTVTIAKGSIGKRVYTATWTANTYTVTLITNGGKIREGYMTEYTYGVGATLPTNVTKNGFFFGGWYDNEDCKGTAISKISTTDIGDKTFYAKWNIIYIPIITFYDIEIDDGITNGDVKASHKTAVVGTTITVTVTPDDGYEIFGVYVLSENGKTVTLTEIGNGKYTFKMPASDVTVFASFKKSPTVSDCPRDYTCPIWPYSDASTKAWYHDGVHYCIEHGIMTGYPGKLFGPNDNTTRAQVVTMLWRLEGKPVVNYLMSFEDVATESWYAEAVRWAASTDVVEGYSDEKFGPNDSITREQLVTIMWRYAKLKGIDVSVGEDTNILSYSDAFDVAEWAIPAMQWACGSGVIQGIKTAKGMSLAPESNATRAQIATIFRRYCEDIVEDED